MLVPWPRNVCARLYSVSNVTASVMQCTVKEYSTDEAPARNVSPKHSLRTSQVLQALQILSVLLAKMKKST